MTATVTVTRRLGAIWRGAWMHPRWDENNPTRSREELAFIFSCRLVIVSVIALAFLGLIAVWALLT